MAASSGPVVVFQGEPGAYSEAAALELLGKETKTLGLESFERCFKAVEDGSANFALLPIENSLGGTIHANFDLQLRHNFFVVAEHSFRVRHCLMALPGVQMSEIEKVLSHPQALAQCDGFLRERNLTGEAAYDTAGSAKLISENQAGNLGKCAAIASSLAASHYGLEILDSSIEDDSNNFTRFLLVSRRWLPLSKSVPSSSVKWKTTMVFSLVNNLPGALVKALSAFSFRDVDLAKLESRPDKMRLHGRTLVRADNPDVQQIPAQDLELLARLNDFPELDGSLVTADSEPSEAAQFRFVFYVDCLASLADANLQNALRHLSEITPFLRILGCYPQNSVLNDYVATDFQTPHGAVRSETAIPPSITPTAGSVDMAATSADRKLKIGILGFGNFGQFLAKTFTKYHDVFACSRTDYSAVAASMGVGYTNTIEEMFAQASGIDCLVVSVSILSFESVIRRIPMNLLENVLVVDVLSVKMLPKTVLQVVLPESAGILCTHPMYGPESGKHSWRGLPFVYEKVRVANQLSLCCEQFLDIFRVSNCRMVEMTCETHDEAAAGSQFVTHFTGRMLAQLGLRSTPINTKGFETLLALVDNTCKDSLDLFRALYKCNPNSTRQLKAIRESMNSLIEALEKGDGDSEDAANSTAQTMSDEALHFSEFIGRIQPSKTSETHALALELKRTGKDIVTTLTVGEPDFAPPEPILAALAEAGAKGMTKYTPVGGMFECKQAISDDYANRKGVRYDPTSQILVTSGGKQAIFQAVLALCDKGDEVIIPSPYWVSYPEIVNLSGAKPVLVERDPANGYIMTPQQLEAALTPNTRMLIFCNPCNPTGSMYTKDELMALVEVLSRPEHKNVLILADEIYERLVYDNVEHVSFAALPGMLERTLLVNGFAKAFAMTGFRLGYLACANPKMIAAALKLQSQINSCASSVSQYAGIAALREVPDEMLKPLYAELLVKRDTIISALRDIPHIICPVPKGAFYVFPDVSYYLGKGARSSKSAKVIETSTDLCSYLIQEHGLALPPGDAFGGAYGVRFSYATSLEDIKKATDRFRAGLEALVF